MERDPMDGAQSILPTISLRSSRHSSAIMHRACIVCVCDDSLSDSLHSCSLVYADMCLQVMLPLFLPPRFRAVNGDSSHGTK